MQSLPCSQSLTGPRPRRFNMLFGRDSESMPRTWVGKEDIRAITREARVGALRLLSVLAAVRLDAIDGPDTVSEALETLLEGQEGSMAVHAHTDGGSTAGTKEAPSRNALAGATWENVSEHWRCLEEDFRLLRRLWKVVLGVSRIFASHSRSSKEDCRRSPSVIQGGFEKPMLVEAESLADGFVAVQHRYTVDPARPLLQR